MNYVSIASLASFISQQSFFSAQPQVLQITTTSNLNSDRSLGPSQGVPYPTSTARVDTVLPLKIVSVETGVPGEKPLQGRIGYLAYLYPRSEPIYANRQWTL